MEKQLENLFLHAGRWANLLQSGPATGFDQLWATYVSFFFPFSCFYLPSKTSDSKSNTTTQFFMVYTAVAISAPKTLKLKNIFLI